MIWAMSVMMAVTRTTDLSVDAAHCPFNVRLTHVHAHTQSLSMLNETDGILCLNVNLLKVQQSL